MSSPAKEERHETVKIEILFENDSNTGQIKPVGPKPTGKTVLPVAARRKQENASKNIGKIKPDRPKPTGKTILPVGAQRKQENASKRCESSSLIKSEEPSKMNKSSSMSPNEALKMYKSQMTSFEHQEILKYPEVFFLGLNAEKHAGVIGGSNNCGYDNREGFYKQVMKDHVAYRYEVQKILGKGSFGEVVMAYDHKLQQQVAIKMVRNGEKFSKLALEEVRILKLLKKQDKENKMNVIHILDKFIFRSHVCIVFELLSKSLLDLLKKDKFQGLSLPVVRKFACSILNCLEVLNKNHIIHCDLKPENILLKQEGKDGVKVVDFGCSCYDYQTSYTYIQTRYYRAPEVILGNSYGMPIDMWSLGCILAELLTGSPLLPGFDEKDQLERMIELLGMPPKQIRMKLSKRGKERGPPGSRTMTSALKGCKDSLFIDFIKKCLEWDPALRMTPSQALQHSWIKKKYKGTQTQTKTSTERTQTPHKIPPKKLDFTNDILRCPDDSFRRDDKASQKLPTKNLYFKTDIVNRPDESCCRDEKVSQKLPTKNLYFKTDIVSRPDESCRRDEKVSQKSPLKKLEFKADTLRRPNDSFHTEEKASQKLPSKKIDFKTDILTRQDDSCRRNKTVSQKLTAINLKTKSNILFPQNTYSYRYMY
ncbi:dual specificity tyrosine-phosphorylation-regulated kinase 2-like [Rhinophrynus dorsalis]